MLIFSVIFVLDFVVINFIRPGFLPYNITFLWEINLRIDDFWKILRVAFVFQFRKIDIFCWDLLFAILVSHWLLNLSKPSKLMTTEFHQIQIKPQFATFFMIFSWSQTS